MEARGRHATAWRVRVSKSFAKRRQRVSPAGVRSTLPRGGTTATPLYGSLRGRSATGRERRTLAPAWRHPGPGAAPAAHPLTNRAPRAPRGERPKLPPSRAGRVAACPLAGLPSPQGSPPRGRGVPWRGVPAAPPGGSIARPLFPPLPPLAVDEARGRTPGPVRVLPPLPR